MSSSLRKYQVEALDALHAAMQTQDRLLLQAATGAGKTVAIVRLIATYFERYKDRSYLILMHKRELVEQFIRSFKKFSDVSPYEIGIACAGVSPDHVLHRRITIASVQTMANNLGAYPGADLIVVDETHRISHDHSSQYQTTLSKLMEYRPWVKVIGVTATAYRLGHGMIYGTNCRPDRTNFFPELTHRITYAELVSSGHLMPLTGRVASAESITEDLKVVQVSGDYNLGQLGSVMSKTIHIQSAVDAFEQYGLDHKSVCVFACTIEHAEMLREAFSSKGHSAVVIHSKLSEIERAANLNAWRSGQVRIAVSVNILIEGFDFPELSCLVFCRPTKSPAIYVQAIGRILRKAEGKAEALLIDLTDNTLSFGLDLDNPKFTIPSGFNGGEAPQKVCQGEKPDGTACGQLVHASLKYCPYCQYEFEVDEAVEAKLGTLKKVEFSAVAEPVTYSVDRVMYHAHESKNSGKNLIKVTYECGLANTFSEYICLPDNYTGYAVEKARIWWEERSSEPLPDNIDEFMFLSGDLAEPVQIEVVKDGKYDRIVRHIFYDQMDLEDFNPNTDQVVVYIGDEVPF